MIQVKIGNHAASILGLDGGAAKEMGIVIAAVNKVTTTILLDRDKAKSLASELEDRGCARGEGWASEPAERAACRRAARTLREALDVNRLALGVLKKALFDHGAQPSYGGAPYVFRLDTPAGVLRVSPYEPHTAPGELWVHARFDEPQRAREVLTAASANADALNPHSGKWNATSHTSFLAGLDRLMNHQPEK